MGKDGEDWHRLQTTKAKLFKMLDLKHYDSSSKFQESEIGSDLTFMK